MLKYFTISFVNAVYYPFFMVLFALYHYEPNLEFYVSAGVMILLFSYPLLKWITNLNEHVLFRAYFVKSDILFKLIPSLILLLCPLFKDDINPLLYPYILVVPYFLVLIHLMFKFVYLAILAPTLIINNAATFSFTGIMGVNSIKLNKFIQQFTDAFYFIIDDGYTHENTMTVYSLNTSVIFNYHYDFFAIDGIIVNSHTILTMQDEYKKLLFQMSDDELETIKMLAV